MEAVGLTILILSLAALAQTAVDCFQSVQLGKNFGTDFQTTCIRLDNAQLQLSRWGKALELSRQQHAISSRLASCVSGDLASFSHRGHTALSIAAQRGHRRSCVDSLLASGKFSVNVPGPRGRTPLSLAAGAGHDHVVVRLLEEEDIDVGVPDSFGASPVSWAVTSDSPSTSEILFQSGKSNLGALDDSDRCALSWACEYGSRGCVRILIEHGVAVNVQDKSGKTPLMHAVISGELKIVRWLVQRDVGSIHLRDNCDGWAPIAWTLDGSERPRNAELLMPYVVDGLQDGGWVSVFDTALRWGAFAIAQLMAKNEVLDINASDEAGRTALWHAADKGQVEIVRRILARADVTTSDSDINGDTPYSRAALHQHEEICEMLLQYRT
ncbi:uncharacterized protein MYCGRDRAFT_69084 [Zymoseptoria tritici IPO323]|uniref:Prion-inhibition and propagation HeLo domain-containing protein n=1 Tax=Zymoseptoria tritici (strain CBS 115943 / IPO323) TaxID=336722 RepID=F9X4Q9_ZYMTI|nr:uncharacterized protein MYCGRDRAFT_69084 [Zymoseptoria tritici IPO323]EGP90261.1 hypothetical protein MYCGRDRAFT_69084 [Zymoseptoria tritici IPO323]